MSREECMERAWPVIKTIPPFIDRYCINQCLLPISMAIQTRDRYEMSAEERRPNTFIRIVENEWQSIMAVCVHVECGCVCVGRSTSIQLLSMPNIPIGWARQWAYNILTFVMR